MGIIEQEWACIHTNPAQRAVGVKHRKVCCGMLDWELTDIGAALGQGSSAFSDTARKRETWSSPCLILPVLLFL